MTWIIPLSRNKIHIKRTPQNRNSEELSIILNHREMYPHCLLSYTALCTMPMQLLLIVQVAHYIMSLFYLALLRRFFLTTSRAVRTACMELAARRRICRRRDRAFQHDTVHSRIRIRDRDCRKQSLCIWMKRIFENICCLTILYEISEIHNAYRIRNMLYDRKVVRDKQIRQ